MKNSTGLSVKPLILPCVACCRRCRALREQQDKLSLSKALKPDCHDGLPGQGDTPLLREIRRLYERVNVRHTYKQSNTHTHIQTLTHKHTHTKTHTHTHQFCSVSDSSRLRSRLRSRLVRSRLRSRLVRSRLRRSRR